MEESKEKNQKKREKLEKEQKDEELDNKIARMYREMKDDEVKDGIDFIKICREIRFNPKTGRRLMLPADNDEMPSRKSKIETVTLSDDDDEIPRPLKKKKIAENQKEPEIVVLSDSEPELNALEENQVEIEKSKIVEPKVVDVEPSDENPTDVEKANNLEPEFVDIFEDTVDIEENQVEIHNLENLEEQVLEVEPSEENQVEIQKISDLDDFEALYLDTQEFAILELISRENDDDDFQENRVDNLEEQNPEIPISHEQHHLEIQNFPEEENAEIESSKNQFFTHDYLEIPTSENSILQESDFVEIPISTGTFDGIVEKPSDEAPRECELDERRRQPEEKPVERQQKLERRRKEEKPKRRRGRRDPVGDEEEEVIEKRVTRSQTKKMKNKRTTDPLYNPAEISLDHPEEIPWAKSPVKSSKNPKKSKKSKEIPEISDKSEERMEVDNGIMEPKVVDDLELLELDDLAFLENSEMEVTDDFLSFLLNDSSDKDEFDQYL